MSNYMEDFYDSPHEINMFQPEQELKKEIKRLERMMKRLILEQEKELDNYRKQIADLLAKNMDLTEANRIFAKGIENLKNEYIVTETHQWSRKGARGLKERIMDFVADGKRIVAIVPTFIDPQGHMVEGMIVTEHTTKIKPQPVKLFKDG